APVEGAPFLVLAGSADAAATDDPEVPRPRVGAEHDVAEPGDSWLLARVAAALRHVRREAVDRWTEVRGRRIRSGVGNAGRTQHGHGREPGGGEAHVEIASPVQPPCQSEICCRLRRATVWRSARLATISVRNSRASRLTPRPEKPHENSRFHLVREPGL